MADRPPNTGLRVYTWEEFDADARKIADTIKAQGLTFRWIYGPPRGGMPLAIRLSHLLLPDNQRTGSENNKFVFTPVLPNYAMLPSYNKYFLIVDDIADTGKTLSHYNVKEFFIATLFKHPQSVVTPDIWIREKDDRWVQFPWEAP